MKVKLLAHLLVASMIVGTAAPAQADSEDAGRIIGGLIGALIGNEASNGKAGGVVVGALVGALIGGEVAKELDDDDRRVIVDRHEYAYDGELNTPYHWRSRNSDGHVIIIREGYYQSRKCRRYRTTTTVHRRHGKRTYTSSGWVCKYPGRGWIKTDYVNLDDHRVGLHRYEYMKHQRVNRYVRELRNEYFDSNRMNIVEEMVRKLDRRGKVISGRNLSRILATFQFSTGSNSRMRALRKLAPYTSIGGTVRNVVDKSGFTFSGEKKRARRILRNNAILR